MASFIDQLRSAIAGLLYPSESDEPFEVITWPAALSPIAAVEANTTRRPIEAVGVRTFFGELASDPQCFKFGLLRGLLEGNLKEVSVFRVGDGSEIDVYVIGKDEGGNWTGVQTKSVET